MKGVSRNTFLAIVFYAIVSISVFSPYLFFKKTYIPSDIQNWILPWALDKPTDVQVHYVSDVIGEHYPYKHLLKQSLKNNVFPFWNPYNFFGVPQVSISTTIYCDIFNVLYFISDSVVIDAIIASIKIFLSGLFLFLLLQFYKVSVGSSLLGGLAFMLNGAFINMHTFYWTVGAFLWLPLIILFLEKSFDKEKSIKFIIYAGLALGLSHLGGHLQISIQIFLALFFWMLAKLFFKNDKNSFSFIRPILTLGVVYIISLLIAAFSFIPLLELISLGAARNYSILEWFNRIPQNILKIPFIVAFLIPNFFGDHSTFSPVLITGEKWTSYLMGFVGFIPLVFGLIAMIFVKSNHIKLYSFIGLGTLAGLFLTPLVVFLYFRTLILWCFAISILSGFGLDYLLGRSSRAFLSKVIKFTISLLSLLVVGLLAVQLVIQVWGGLYIPRIEKYIEKISLTNNATFFAVSKKFYVDKVGETFQYYSIQNPNLLTSLGVIGGFVVALLLLKHNKLSNKKFQLIIIILTFIELAYFFFLYIPVIDLKKYPLYPEMQSTKFLHSDTSVYRAMCIVEPGIDPPIYHFESNIPHKIQIAHHCGSINYSRSSKFAQSLGNSNSSIVNLANIKYFLTKSVHLDTSKFPLVYHGEINIYQNPDVLPRAFVVTSYRVSKLPDSILRDIQSPTFKPEITVFLEERPYGIILDSVLNLKIINITKYDQQYVKLKSETDGNSLLVFTDTQYPGWKAFIDEKETKIFTADYIFRAIYLPKGLHNIEFRFEPLSFRVGLLISISCLFICLVVLIASGNKYFKK